MPDFKQLATRMNVAQWIAEERAGHADVKYGSGTAANDLIEKQVLEGGLDDNALNFIGNYLKRAQLAGVDTPLGRQALGKAAVTCIAYLERSVFHFGPMPEPGHPSGEVREWHSQ